MKLADISGLDPDTPPYFVLAPDGTAVPVAFAPLTPAPPLALPCHPASRYRLLSDPITAYCLTRHRSASAMARIWSAAFSMTSLRTA